MVRLPQPVHAPFINNRRKAAGGIVVALGSFAAIITCARADSSRPPHFSGAFADYYVGVLYRDGKYRGAASLAKGLIDGGWISKEAACVSSVTRAYLVVQIARRLGRGQPAISALGAQVQAMRHWVRGSDPSRSAAGDVAAIASLDAKTRVLGWHKMALEPAGPIQLEATPAREQAALMAVPVLAATVLGHAVQPSKTYEQPPPKPVAVLREPEPVARKSRKPKSAREASGPGAKAATPNPQSEPWMEKVFVN
ncbi:MAG: hypothetical protein ABL901_08850 [Hyphomicrobiaceae bacterium]